MTDLKAFAKSDAELPFFAPHATTLAQRWSRALSGGDGLPGIYENGRLLGVYRFLQSGTFVSGAYLRLITVEPAQQSKGLGALLLAAFEAACSQAHGGCFVLTSDKNLGAQQFYARHEYNVVGQLPGFAGPERSEQMLWKVLGFCCSILPCQLEGFLQQVLACRQTKAMIRDELLCLITRSGAALHTACTVCAREHCGQRRQTLRHIIS